MRKRTKSAIAAFIVLAIAYAVIFSFDYTDTYVSGRFHKALEAGKYTKGDPFSLDAFMEYYDWDAVCVVLPYSDQEFSDILGRSYTHAATDDSIWSMVFIKGDHVTAEIPIRRDMLEAPAELTTPRFDRWSAIVSINDNDSPSGADLRMVFTGN